MDGGRSARRLALLAFVTGLSGAMMPGPLLVLGIEQTAARGLSAMAWLITGHALLELFLVALLVTGLRWVLLRPKVRATVGIVGGIALIYMGGSMLLDAATLRLDLDTASASAHSIPLLILLGALVSVANPYFTGWWATIGLGQLAQMAPRSPREYGAFYIGHECADFGWYLLIGILVVTGRQWLTPGLYSAMVACFAVILLALAGWFLWTALGMLRPSKPRPQS